MSTKVVGSVPIPTDSSYDVRPQADLNTRDPTTCRQITVSVCITEGGSIGDHSRWQKEGLLNVLLFESVELLSYLTLKQ